MKNRQLTEVQCHPPGNVIQLENDHFFIEAVYGEMVLLKHIHKGSLKTIDAHIPVKGVSPSEIAHLFGSAAYCAN